MVSSDIARLLLSLANPRVWTFTFEVTERLIEELCQVPISEEEKRARETTSLVNLPGLFRVGATSEGLTKVKIEEYPTRVRAHRWLALPNTNPEDWWSLPQGRYDWFDVAISPGRYWKIENRGGMPLWAYSTGAMTGVLTLSGSWEWDSTKKRAFFQLTLWFDREPLTSRESKVLPPTDIICKIPLEPGRLCDEQGRSVYDGGVERRATEVEPFPSDDENWKYECGEGTDWRWSWYLHMETFNSGWSNRGWSFDSTSDFLT